MEREEKLMLIQRSLGIRHKLKVYDSMKSPDTHEDLAIMMMARWDLEDELRAIEEILTQDRLAAVGIKRKEIETDLDLFSDRPVRAPLPAKSRTTKGRKSATR